MNFLRPFFGIALITFSSQLYAADGGDIQRTLERTKAPMTCGKFLAVMSTGQSLSQAQSLKLQELANQLTLHAGIVAGNQLGPIDQKTIQVLAEELHRFSESEYRKVMDSILSIQDLKTRNEKITQTADACMGLVKSITNK